MKKSVRKHSPKKKTVKRKGHMKKFFYIQIVLTLLIAGYIIMSSITPDKAVTGNVIGANSPSSSTGSASSRIFLILGVGLALFAFIEMIVLLITSFF